MPNASPPPDVPPVLPNWLVACERAQDEAIQAAHRLAHAAEPSYDLQPAADAIAAAVAAIHAAIDLRSDRLSEARQGMGRLIEAVGALAESDDDPMVTDARQLLEQARNSLLQAENELASKPAELTPEPRPLRASVETLQLHDVRRASLAPRIKVPEPPPAPPLELPPLEPPQDVSALAETMKLVQQRADQRRKAREERAAQREQPVQEPALAAALPQGFAAPIEPALTADQFCHMRLRELFEEVAMLGSQRAPQLGDAWRALEYLEKRMFACIDAVAALGARALHGIEELVLDSPVKDPTRGFAAIMMLGSVEGRDTLAAADRIVRYLDADDAEVARYAAEAFKLVPHPHIGLSMRTMLQSSEVTYRALALEVLAHRNLASLSELITFAHDEAPQVAGIALQALALASPRHPELPNLLVQSVEKPGLEAATWLAMALSGHPNATRGPLAALDQGALAEDAAMALALVSNPTVAATLRDRCNKTPSTALVRALGWTGAAESVPELIELLRSEDEDLVVQTAYALDRITGAELYEDAEIDPEQIIIPDAPLPELPELDPPAAPLATEVSDPRDAPSDGSPDTITRPSTNPQRWHDWWQERKGGFTEGGRYRRGHGYTPTVALWELDGWILTAPERLHLQHELVVRTGHWVRFDPGDFVDAQQRALTEWEAVVKSQTSTPGSWAQPSRRV